MDACDLSPNHWRLRHFHCEHFCSSQLPTHINKDDYDNAVKRNLHAWTDWRTNINDNLINSMNRDRVSPQCQILSGTHSGEKYVECIKENTPSQGYTIKINVFLIDQGPIYSIEQGFLCSIKKAPYGATS